MLRLTVNVDCPHCGDEVEIDINTPTETEDYDDNLAECPNCGKALLISFKVKCRKT